MEGEILGSPCPEGGSWVTLHSLLGDSQWDKISTSLLSVLWLKLLVWDFSLGPVVKTLNSYWRGRGFDPWMEKIPDAVWLKKKKKKLVQVFIGKQMPSKKNSFNVPCFLPWIPFSLRFWNHGEKWIISRERFTPKRILSSYNYVCIPPVSEE